MLILTRKENEAIVISDNIEITILSIKGDQVKIGINAPQNIKVFRKEIVKDIQEANIEATNINMDAIDNLKNILNTKKKEEKKEEK